MRLGARSSGLVLVVVVFFALPVVDARAQGRFPSACKPGSTDRAFRSFARQDAWRFTSAYRFPFFGRVRRGRSRVIWRPVGGWSGAKHRYPAPNLPSCRVGRFGTEDRATRKAGKHFRMLLPLDGQRVYELKDTFDRPVATLAFYKQSPIAGRPSRWGWFVNGRWAGHGASRAIEAQSAACKLVAEPVPGALPGEPAFRWARDPRYVMIAFNPSLGRHSKRFTPKRAIRRRVRAFVDRRAVPLRQRRAAERFDFGCGASSLPTRVGPRTLRGVFFRSGVVERGRRIRDYYFGEATQVLHRRPTKRHLYNHYPLRHYNPRPQFNHAMYAMASTTGVAAGGMVRGIVRSGVDRLTLLDEMRYCDPNYTLGGMKLKRGKKRIKRSRFLVRATYSSRNRPAVRWVYGRVDPDPRTLTPEQLVALRNPQSLRMTAWLPRRCGS